VRSIRTVLLAASVATTLVMPVLGFAQDDAAMLRQNDAAMLRQIISEIESERKIVFSPFGASSWSSLYVLDRDQVGAIAGHQVMTGMLHPDSIVSWTRQQIAFSRVAIQVMKEQLKELEKGGPPAPGSIPPSVPMGPVDPNAIYWPAPMNWLAVRGTVRGSFVAECAGWASTGHPAVSRTGSYKLEFRGDGSIGGAFEEGSRLHHVTGKILADGTASGTAQSGATDQPSFNWTASFRRSGDALQMSSHTLDIIAASRGTYAILVECKPGYMRQE
jgi:hypothetical protein